MLTFVKNYKEDETLRRSLSALAKSTFGISFEAWYQKGCWDDHYIPFSFHDEGKVVANVSVNIMSLVIDGVNIPAIQIGTVMTHPDYRRRGLAYELFQKIFETYDGAYTLYYLAADREAMPLYEKCGFSEIAETHYIITRLEYMAAVIPSLFLKPMDIKKTTLSLSSYINWKQCAIPKGAQFEILDDLHIATFYYFHGFDDNLYLLSDKCLVVAEIEDDGETLVLYDYYTKENHTLHDIISAIFHNKTWSIKQIKLAFDITGMSIITEMEIDPKSGWMIRARDHRRLPKYFTYPKLSQA